ncbi:hypothetical protein [Enterococcus sp. AZ196]|uniref:hypothetical protein n=1 Tax=Enterococcus sp. AZ196 TaxID=2774659 RepID=UPI003D2E2167
MKKIFLVGVVTLSVFVFSACQKSETTKTDTSEKQTSTEVEQADTSSSIENSPPSTNSESKAIERDQEENNLTDEEIAVAIYLTPETENQTIDTVIDDYVNAYEKDEGYGTKLQLSKRVLPDIILSFSSMGTTQRIHFEGDLITVTSRSNSGEEFIKTFSKKEINSRFSNYQEDLALLVSKAENYSPLQEQKESSESNVDTKSLTSEQLKDWVSAVLDTQFSMGRVSFPYDLSIENREGYAYVRVKHKELQVDTITMFRINGEGQLEEEDKSNGYPVSYKVMSSTFMDTTEVTLIE